MRNIRKRKKNYKEMKRRKKVETDKKMKNGTKKKREL